MKGFGVALICVGAIIGLIAFLLPTSVDTVIPDFSGGLGTLRSDVVNVSLLQRQSMTFGMAAVLFICGFIMVGAGAVTEAIGRLYPSNIISESSAVGTTPLSNPISAEHSDEAAAVQPVSLAEPQSDFFTWMLIGTAVFMVAIVLAVAYVSLRH